MSATRGYGLLEAWLANLRARKADALLPDDLRRGHLVDIGCGVTPTFLINTKFSQKTGIDSVVRSAKDNYVGISLLVQDFFEQPVLTFDSNSIQAVTMLAVFEHIEVNALPLLIREINRVLAPGGVFILTVPAGWTDPVLKLLARIGAVSATEIFDHKAMYDRAKVTEILAGAGFQKTGIETGFFEIGMNIWARAEKHKTPDPLS